MLTTHVQIIIFKFKRKNKTNFQIIFIFIFFWGINLMFQWRLVLSVYFLNSNEKFRPYMHVAYLVWILCILDILHNTSTYDKWGRGINCLKNFVLFWWNPMLFFTCCASELCFSLTYKILIWVDDNWLWEIMFCFSNGRILLSVQFLHNCGAKILELKTTKRLRTSTSGGWLDILGKHNIPS